MLFGWARPSRLAMSAPAQNPRPAPVRMITRTWSSCSAASMACSTSFSMCSVQAFSLVGPIERDRGDAVGDVVENFFVSHRGALLAAWLDV